MYAVLVAYSHSSAAIMTARSCRPAPAAVLMAQTRCCCSCWHQRSASVNEGNRGTSPAGTLTSVAALRGSTCPWAMTSAADRSAAAYQLTSPSTRPARSRSPRCSAARSAANTLSRSCIW